MNFKSFFCTLIFCIFIALVNSLQQSNIGQHTNLALSRFMLNNSECNSTYQEKTDHVVAKLLGFGKYGRPFPENEAQLKAYCRETTELSDQVEAFFRNCYQRDVRDVASVMLFSLKRVLRQFCRKRNPKLTQLLQSTSCINQNLIGDDHCLKLFADNVKPLINVEADDKTKIRYACCAYVKSMKCSDDVMTKTPCIGEHKEMLLDFLRGLFGNFAASFCREYNETTERCRELGPPPKPQKKNKKHYTTFLFVLLDLLESFTNFQLPS